MKNNIIIINKRCSKYTIKEKINNFLTGYEEDFYPLIRIKTKTKEIIGICYGTRHYLNIKTFQNKIRSVEFKDITSVKILNNDDIFKIIYSLTRTNTALSAKRLKEATLQLKELILVAKKIK